MSNSQELWQNVKSSLDHTHFTLGPYFGYQMVHTPRHLLFTLSRYKFAAKMLPVGKKLNVLEMGCGEGVGTLMLAEQGHNVTGVDFDGNAIQHAQESITNENIRFKEGDFLIYRDKPVDAVVSLDVIEHIEKKLEVAYCETIVENLTDTGFAIIGTPNITANQYASKPSQIGHVNLFSAERLQELFSQYFHNVFNFGMNDEVLHTGFSPMCHYLFVVACNKK